MFAKLNARLNAFFEPKLKDWANRSEARTLKIIRLVSLIALTAIWLYLVTDWVIRLIQFLNLGIEFPRSAFVVEVILVSVSLVPLYGYLFSDMTLWRYKNIF